MKLENYRNGQQINGCQKLRMGSGVAGGKGICPHKGSTRDPSDDGNVQYLDCDSGDTHMVKLHRTQNKNTNVVQIKLGTS